MAWFHHGVQDASQPQSSSIKDLALDGHAFLEPNPTTTIVGTSSNKQRWPQLLQTSKTHLPSAAQDMVFPSMVEPLCTSSPYSRVSDGPVPFSYVTLQEQRCVLNWFLGWGPSQRECFLQDLISKALPRKVSSLLEQLNALKVKDHPPNIFECQLRLWTQWFETWSEEERNGFLDSLEDKDSIFVAQFYKDLARTTEIN